MKINKLIAFALFISSASFGQSLQSAIQKTDNERFDEATKEFKSLIEKEPLNCVNYFYLGENFYAQEKRDSAIVYWTKASEKDPTCALAMVSAGKVLWVKGESAKAKEQFTLALTKTKNKNADIIRQIAKTYIVSENKNLDEAILLLETAVKLDPKNEDGLLLLGDALLEKTPENGSNAIKQYNKALELNPNSVRCIVRKGILYKRAQNFPEASKEFLRAQTIDPTYAPAYRENAELNLLFNKSKLAIENWKKYLDLNNSIDARYRYVTAMYQGKLYCEVIPEILDIQGNNFNNYFMERMLANSYAECSKDSLAATKGLKVSDEFFRIVPSDKIVSSDYKYRGILYVNMKKDSLAILELEKASRLNEDTKKELAGQIAKLYMKAKKYPKTIENYEYKLTIKQLSAFEEFELGRAYFLGPKNYSLADSAFSRLLKIDSTYAPAYQWIARSRFQLDPKNEKWAAFEPYKKVLEKVKIEDRSLATNKSMVMEAARYLGNYYLNSPAKDPVKAKEFWTIIKELDPNDSDARIFFTKYK